MRRVSLQQIALLLGRGASPAVKEQRTIVPRALGCAAGRAVQPPLSADLLGCVGRGVRIKILNRPFAMPRLDLECSRPTEPDGLVSGAISVGHSGAHQVAAAAHSFSIKIGVFLGLYPLASGHQQCLPPCRPLQHRLPIATSHPAATTGPTPGMASNLSPVSSPTTPPAVAPIPAPVPAPSARSSTPSRSRSMVAGPPIVFLAGLSEYPIIRIV